MSGRNCKELSLTLRLHPTGGSDQDQHDWRPQNGRDTKRVTLPASTLVDRSESRSVSESPGPHGPVTASGSG